jgi:hypothetical protein
MGWNILQSARALRKRAIAARKALRAAFETLIEWLLVQLALHMQFMLSSTRDTKPIRSHRHGRQPSLPWWNPTPA